MNKKVALIAAAGLLTTATLIAATSVHTGKKPAPAKTAKTAVAKEKKADYMHERTHCFD